MSENERSIKRNINCNKPKLMSKLKQQAIVIESTKGKQIDYHTFYDEQTAQRREKRLISEGWTVRRIK